MPAPFLRGQASRNTMTALGVHVALAFDDGFWAPAYVTMRSICLSSRQPREPVFYLTHTGLSEAYETNLQRIGEEFGAKLRFYNLLEDSAYSGLSPRMRVSSFYPAVIYMRVVFERLVFIDRDVRVRAPIEEPLEADPNGQPMGAVQGISARRAMHGRELHWALVPAGSEQIVDLQGAAVNAVRGDPFVLPAGVDRLEMPEEALPVEKSGGERPALDPVPVGVDAEIAGYPGARRIETPFAGGRLARPGIAIRIVAMGAPCRGGAGGRDRGHPAAFEADKPPARPLCRRED